MNDAVNKLIMNYMILGKNVGDTDVLEAVDILMHLNGNDIISVILECQDCIRPIITGEIPQFSEEKDVYKVLRVLIDSGLENLTYEQIGAYLSPVDAKSAAKRKYGETHYKFATQLGLATKCRPLVATEIGVAYYLLENDEKRQELMNRLVFSIPFVQHSILKASKEQFYMPNYLAEFLAPSTAVRRRSNMHKIMSWACKITEGKYKQIFDNVVWY